MTEPVSVPRLAFVFALAFALPVGCGVPHDPDWRWTDVPMAPEVALTSVHGNGDGDVYVAGTAGAEGGTLLRARNGAFTSLETGADADLWWVHVSPSGVVYAAGSEGTLLRLDGEAFTQLEVPARAGLTVYGLWAAPDDTLLAVGSAQDGRDGFAWRVRGDRVTELTLPTSAQRNGALPGLFKVWGRAADDVWIVGAQGLVLHGSVDGAFVAVPAPTEDTLFTVHAAAQRVVMVGGGAGGVLLELEDGALRDRTPALAPLLQGVSVGPDGVAYAVGLAGSIYRSEGAGEPFSPIDPDLDFAAASVLHGAHVDGQGRVWAVGGNLLSARMDGGRVLRYGPAPR